MTADLPGGAGGPRGDREVVADLPGGTARFAGIDDLLGRTELGTSGWQLVDQARIGSTR